jgi:hypothetical protein
MRDPAEVPKLSDDVPACGVHSPCDFSAALDLSFRFLENTGRYRELFKPCSASPLH